MPLIYECLYFDTPLTSEFNEIEAFTVSEPISPGFDRFNVAKKAIEKSLSNEYTIRIAIKRAIYIGFAKPGFKTIA